MDVNDLANISVTLVEPEDCQNIGSVTRAMKTMGFSKLCIVGREEFDETRVRQLSVHAFDVFENKKLYKSLEDCQADFSLQIAFTRRLGKKRKGVSYSITELCKMITQAPLDSKINLVFGRESSGLFDEEVALCNASCTIESSPLFPSLNLAAAVQVVTYSIYSGLLKEKYNKQTKIKNEETTNVVSIARVRETTSKACQSLKELNYFKLDSDEEENFGHLLEDILSRAMLRERELAYVDKFFKKNKDIILHKN